MQIISGKARGFILEVPKGDFVRPTSSRARKALFDSLGPWNERIILDLFAGSGALGLEAVSRGSRSVTFVEKSPQHIRFIQKNIDKIKRAEIEFKHTTVQADATSFQAIPSDVTDIFADPPYAQTEVLFQNIINNESFAKKIKASTRFIWEIPDEETGVLKRFIGNEYWKVERLRNYGSVWFLIAERL